MIGRPWKSKTLLIVAPFPQCLHVNQGMAVLRTRGCRKGARRSYRQAEAVRSEGILSIMAFLLWPFYDVFFTTSEVLVCDGVGHDVVR